MSEPSSPRATNKGGRPRGSTRGPSAMVCVRVPPTTYDRAYSLARFRACSVPAVLRRALARELRAAAADDDDDDDD